MVRRSIRFGGIIPHFAVLVSNSSIDVPNKYSLIEYIPKTHDVYQFLVYEGKYRVSTYILTKSVEVHTKREVDRLIGE